MSRHVLPRVVLGMHRQYGRATLVSFAVVFCMTSLAGMFFLPRDLSRTRARSDVTVVDCQLCHHGQLLVVLKRRTQGGHHGVQQWLESREWYDHEFQALPLGSEMQPICFVACEQQQRLFVGNANGSRIQLVNLADSTIAGHLGRHIHGVPHTLALSPDERTLVSLSYPGVYAWDLVDSRS